MGGKLSCVRSKEESDTNEKETRPNQYEEIDENFTILPDPGKKKCKTTSNDVPTKPNVIGAYENVALPSMGNQNQHTVTTDTTTAYEIQENSACYQQTDVTSSDFDAKYANQHVAIQSRSTNEIQPVVTKTTSHHVTNGVSSSSNKKNGHSTTETSAVYAKVKKPKSKGGDESKHSESKPPPVKPKATTKLKEPQTPPVKGQQLTYIEVEFSSPPANAKKPDSSPPAAKKSDLSTTYTDVIHKGGRLVLIQ